MMKGLRPFLERRFFSAFRFVWRFPPSAVKSSAEGVQRRLGLVLGGYNGQVTLIEYEHQLPGQRGICRFGYLVFNSQQGDN